MSHILRLHWSVLAMHPRHVMSLIDSCELNIFS